MVQLMQIGPRGYQKGIGVAVLNFTPLIDRAAYVRRVIIDNPSASDVWVLSVQGRELARFPINTTGNQQLLGGTAANYPKNSDLFAFFREAFDMDLVYPVPLGYTLNIASVGGATANIIVAFEERTAGDTPSSMVNHPEGTHFIFPLCFVPGAGYTGNLPGQYDFASQIAPSWIPAMFGQTELPAGYRVTVLASFLEGMGRNTFSGGADHRSATDHLGLYKNGQRMFTRGNLDGIPLIGPTSATGSANTATGAVTTPFPAFQLVEYINWQPFTPPLVINGGDQYRFVLGLAGDITGGADYSPAVQVLLVDLVLTGVAAQ